MLFKPGPPFQGRGGVWWWVYSALEWWVSKITKIYSNKLNQLFWTRQYNHEVPGFVAICAGPSMSVDRWLHELQKAERHMTETTTFWLQNAMRFGIQLNMTLIWPESRVSGRNMLERWAGPLAKWFSSWRIPWIGRVGPVMLIHIHTLLFDATFYMLFACSSTSPAHLMVMPSCLPGCALCSQEEWQC